MLQKEKGNDPPFEEFKKKTESRAIVDQTLKRQLTKSMMETSRRHGVAGDLTLIKETNGSEEAGWEWSYLTGCSAHMPIIAAPGR